ncbi:MAG: 50S ribosomal protein L22 [Nanoarchaeota archaeon]|nr:50S ribosomal protein L22 [Nanoarchaeota archaeon]
MNEIAKLNAKDLRISTKQSIEICDFIRFKNLSTAKDILERVMKKKMAIPFKRFNRDLGHKHGIASGSYPMNASLAILKLLKGVEANAENVGLNKNELYISKLMANKGSTQWHFGRKRRRQMKRTNIYLEVAEKIKNNPVKVKK